MINTRNILERIEVSGIVQGVGFRPFVFNIARKHNIHGYIQNNPDGVVIEAEGKPENIESFAYDIAHNAPVLSRITGIRRRISDSAAQPEKFSRFEIRASEQKGKPATLISPDVCICEDCLKELFDTGNRRYLYPFINCTNCGPRFTIIRRLPYDRPFTTMAPFTMCPDCEREYNDPADRRFHAQPNACPVCGPRIILLDNNGKIITGDPVTGTIELLQSGQIVAVKGLGGFHLAVDGTNEKAVKRLRERKHRGEKPFALMTGNVETARKIVYLSETEEDLLCSRERPIALARRRDGGTLQIADPVAPLNPYLGIMLPYTPLHYMIFFNPGAGGDYNRSISVFTALVMTSGNISEEPICKDNNEIIERMTGIADAFLVHDRGIHVRSDDSVVSAVNGNISFIRRSRGYAPMPVFLPEPAPQVLALGGEIKNTLCLTDGNRGFISQHIGDLDNIPTLGFFEEAVEHFTKILDIKPVVFAYDLHPEYLSTKYFFKLRKNFGEKDFGAVGVQHHHAHIASVMAEHGYSEPVIGFSMDGTGYGLDETIWGGEVLLCTPTSFVRFAHLDYVPLPGGSAAVREPWRMAFSYLRSVFGENLRSLDLPCLKCVSPDELDLLEQACAAGLNSPLTSSLGRLFDAVAGILDIRQYSAFEGQAAMMLEANATEKHPETSPGTPDVTLPFNIHKCPAEKYDDYPALSGNISRPVYNSKFKIQIENININNSYILDFKPLVQNLVEEIQRGRSKSVLAAAFHSALIVSFLKLAELARDDTGINTVAFSGGCWQNRILSEQFQSQLKERRFDVMSNRMVPVNDGGLSLGQAFVAAKIAGAKKG